MSLHNEKRVNGIDLNSLPLVNVPTPSSSGDATNKSYVDTKTVSGDVTGTLASSTVTKLNGTSLAGLATGILKNTTTTGVPSIAVAADFPTLNQNTTGSAATLTTSRNIDGQAFNGSANITVIAPGTHAATSKTTPVDADELPLVDSATSFVLKKLTWANLKAAIKSYYDSVSSTLTNKTFDTAGTGNSFSINGVAATGNTGTGGNVVRSLQPTIVQGSWTAVTFQNSWVNFGGTANTAAYMLDSMGFVHLKGFVKSGTVGASIFTLPAGFRPLGYLRCIILSNGSVGALDIDNSTGQVIPGGAATNASVSLDNITFRAES